MALLNQNSGFSRWQGWAGYNFSCALTDFLQPKYMGKVLLFSLVQKVQHPPIYFCPSFMADVCLAPLWVQSILCSTLFFPFLLSCFLRSLPFWSTSFQTTIPANQKPSKKRKKTLPHKTSNQSNQGPKARNISYKINSCKKTEVYYKIGKNV